jgi:hypothetical protein
MSVHAALVMSTCLALVQPSTLPGAEKEPPRLNTYVFPTHDLDLATAGKDGGQSAGDEIAELIRGTIEPRSWERAGGRGNLEYRAFARVLIITQTEEIAEKVRRFLTSSDLELTVKTYPLGVVMRQLKVTGKEKTVEQELMALIARTVAPNSWSERGGRGVMEYYPRSQSLIVKQTRTVHERITELLVRLLEDRAATGSEEASEPQPAREDKLEKLLEKYEKACASGDMAKARKLAEKALKLNPACFSKDRKTRAGVRTGRAGTVYPLDPIEKMSNLLKVSEGSRTIKDEWERFWLIDQPSHMTIERIHGGIQE